jgi:hypothetical protein
MKWNQRIRLVAILFALAFVTFAVAGCGRGGDATQARVTEKEHTDWWCQEHGVPEEKCSLCLPAAKVKEMFKDKGDWCKIHNRAQSQCFKCDPSLYEGFEKMYIAKYNEKPKRPPESEFKK